MYWLSASFHTLFESARAGSESNAGARETDTDVLIIGSGYGGAIAAQKLASHFRPRRKPDGQAIRLMILERGRELLPGEFPEDIAELPSQVRINRQGATDSLGYAAGLFQLYANDADSDSNVSVLVASALGGGSQINANVAKRPLPAVFNHPRWPREWAADRSVILDSHFEKVTTSLAAKPLPEHLTPAKLMALERLHTQLQQPMALGQNYRATFERPPITVNFERFANGINPAGVAQPECIQCGNCCSGCNTGAKNTLTTNYLARAKADGAEIYTEALVDQVRWDEKSGLYSVDAHPVAVLDLKDHDRPLTIRARIVILAAGSLGSTEILQRSQSLSERISKALGDHFSTNGDTISARYRTKFPVHAMGLGLDARHAAQELRPGPTITGAIQIVPGTSARMEDGQSLPSFTVEDCAIPLALSELGAELVTTSAMLRNMTDGFRRQSPENIDPLANDETSMAHTEFYLAMTRDSASGKIRLNSKGASGEIPHAKIQWPGDRPWPREAPQHSASQAMLDDILAQPRQIGGTYLPNPLREPVPASIGDVIKNAPAGAAVTVHPLGGCAMGDNATSGVVDYRGRVFDRSNGRVLPGLYVMDGSIIPCSLETNPFLTIAAFADHHADKLIELDLETLIPGAFPHDRPDGPDVAATKPAILPVAPVIRRQTAPRRPTRYTFKERLRQKLVSTDGLEHFFDLTPVTADALEQGLIYLEMSLQYSPDNLKAFLASPDHRCSFQGQLRLLHRKCHFPAFGDDDWEQLGQALPVGQGEIQLFRTAAAPSLRSALRAGLVYWKRRFKRESGIDGNKSIKLSDASSFLSFLGHAGACREVRYDFVTRDRQNLACQWRGLKRISYRDDSNVWKDLFSLPLTARLKENTLWSGKLDVDVDYFLTQGVPGVESQKSLPDSMLGVLNYGMFYIRIILQTYFYEFGPPDYPDGPPAMSPLPGPLLLEEQSVTPALYWLPVRAWGELMRREPGGDADEQAPCRDFERQLTRLPKRSSAPSDPGFNLVAVYQTPAPSCRGAVLLLHGYAISSSMWVSPHIGTNMTQSLLKAGYDVYVADLRTSSALDDLINHGISFDEVASEDIPCTIEFAWQMHGARAQASSRNIHLVAHCMGSAQFAMAILGQAAQRIRGLTDPSRHPAQRSFEPSQTRLAKACFFQVAPLMAVTRSNAVRGRAAGLFDQLVGSQYVSPWLGQAGRISAVESLLDRLAMSFPYPDGFDTGAPDPAGRSPWVGVTRKAFWLYGQTWDNANLSEAVKQNIHEIIGPVNLGTYRQVGAFARSGRVVNLEGVNEDVKDDYLRAAYGSFESLWLHGERSGMFEKQTTQGTVEKLKQLLAPFGLDHVVSFKSVPEFGHLDSIIGEQAHQHAHRLVLEFLAAPAAEPVGAKATRPIAPGSGEQASDSQHISLQHGLEHGLERVPQPVPQRDLRACSCGPFFSRTSDHKIRIWFFAASPLGDFLHHACIGIAHRPPEGQGPQGWRLRKAWTARQNHVIAALCQFVIEIDAGDLQKGDSIVIGALFEDSSRDNTSFTAHPARPVTLDHHSEEFLRFETSLPALIAQGSYLEPSFAETSRPEASMTAGNQRPRSFLAGSCRYPGWLIDSAEANRANAHWLGYLLSRPNRPEALVLTGDQVYLDYIGNLVSDQARADSIAGLYVNAFGGRTSEQSAWAGILRRLSLHCLMDDHEIADNYSKSSNTAAQSQALALRAFGLFQGPSLPGFPALDGASEVLPKTGSNDCLSGPTRICGHDAFMLDTRSQRSRRAGRLFGDQDFEAFQAWARSLPKQTTKQTTKQKPKFVFTGSVIFPLTANSLTQPASGYEEDTVSAYPEERLRLLRVMINAGLNNVVFVSGDLHLSCSGRGRIHGVDQHGTVQTLSFGFCVSSGLYAPLPFANTRSWELPACAQVHRLPLDDKEVRAVDFEIDQVTEAQVVANISLEPGPSSWQATCEFINAQGESLGKTPLTGGI